MPSISKLSENWIQENLIIAPAALPPLGVLAAGWRFISGSFPSQKCFEEMTPMVCVVNSYGYL
jgi:hypothetical protein